MYASVDLIAARQGLLTHPIVSALTTLPAWQTFMEHHVFAVWDFMSLLKRMQRELTCVSVPWSPAPSARYAHFINELVLNEESDDDGKGGFTSHFELYINAMQLCGADTRRIKAYVAQIKAGTPVAEALTRVEASPGVVRFVTTTMNIAQEGSLPEVCAAFFWGREEIIPNMFGGLLAAVHGDPRFDTLRYYFARHIEMDGGTHSVLAEGLLSHVCSGSEQAQQAARIAAVRTLQARHGLWTQALSACSAQGRG